MPMVTKLVHLQKTFEKLRHSKLITSRFKRLMAIKLGRVLNSGRVFRTQTLKSSPNFCFCFFFLVTASERTGDTF